MAITIEKALEFIYANTQKKLLKILPIEQVLDYVLAEDIIARHNLPPYDNSAMDGYAVKVKSGGQLARVTHTIFAGDNSLEELECGFAIKIMTGARIPFGTECIVPVEDVKLVNTNESNQNKEVNIILPDNLDKNRHIRLCGEDIKSGEKLLHKGQRLHAHHVTLLASQGISHVKVYKKPRVAIFASGNELKMHFETVESYQLYNTNTPTLYSRTLELGCEVEFIGTAHDTMEDIHAHIKSALDCDLVITSGGVSVGDADFTKEAFSKFGYEILFDKIEIKPGKPTTFGKVSNTCILNLPGNPLAAALNFELFGQSIILALSGDEAKYISSIESKMAIDYKLKKGRRTLVAGFFDGKSFKPCDKTAPGMITPLALSNSYIIVDDSVEVLEKGTKVKVISTRFGFRSQEMESLVTN